MKTIKFYEMTLKGKGLVQVPLLAASAILIVLILFDVLDFLGDKTVKWITAGCYLTMAVYNIRPFLYRNYVQWNRGGVLVRINSLWGNNFSFDNIRDVEYTGDTCLVHVHSLRDPTIINLAGIDRASRERFVAIMERRGR